MRGWGLITLTLAVLLLIGHCVDSLKNTVRTHHFERQELTEFHVKPRKHESLETMWIDTHCPHRLGELQVFLDCRAEIKQRMYRTDI